MTLNRSRSPRQSPRCRGLRLQRLLRAQICDLRRGEAGGLAKIGGSAFYAANSLESLTIPEGVTEIGSYAFCAMSRLRTISLPASLKNVCGGEWFGNLFARGTSNNAPENLMNINFADGGYTFSSYDGAVYSADGKALIYSPAAKKSLEFAKGGETDGSVRALESQISRR